jgi:tRNA-(ms[2]io[6]A)-hydroxylase
VSATADALELAWATPETWAPAALAEPLALLSDHAHCELGAASAAQGMIARCPENRLLVERLGAHAIEELRHFRRVHRLLVELGGTLEPVRRNPYAEGLLAHAERGPRNLLDRLLIAAWIERRSLERFECLEHAAREAGSPLAELYAELAPSEAGHARLFAELASALFPEEGVAARLEAWRGREARLIRTLPFAARIHSGPPSAGSDGLGERA